MFFHAPEQCELSNNDLVLWYVNSSSFSTRILRRFCATCKGIPHSVSLSCRISDWDHWFRLQHVPPFFSHRMYCMLLGLRKAHPARKSYCIYKVIGRRNEIGLYLSQSSDHSKTVRPPPTALVMLEVPISDGRGLGRNRYFLWTQQRGELFFTNVG